jgi:hypothetical protein
MRSPVAWLGTAGKLPFWLGPTLGFRVVMAYRGFDI